MEKQPTDQQSPEQEVQRIREECEAVRALVEAAADGLLFGRAVPDARDLVLLAARSLNAARRLLDIVRDLAHQHRQELQRLRQEPDIALLELGRKAREELALLKEPSQPDIAALELLVSQYLQHKSFIREQYGEIKNLRRQLGQELPGLKQEVASLRQQLQSLSEPLPDAELTEIRERAAVLIDRELAGIADPALRELVRHAIGDRNMLLKELRRRARLDKNRQEVEEGRRQNADDLAGMAQEADSEVQRLRQQVKMLRDDDDKAWAIRGPLIRRLWEALAKVPDRTLRGNVHDEAADALEMLIKTRDDARAGLEAVRTRCGKMIEELIDSLLKRAESYSTEAKNCRDYGHQYAANTAAGNAAGYRGAAELARSLLQRDPG